KVRWASIHILPVAPLALERADRLLGDFGREALHVGIGVRQRVAHVLRHRLGVAADVEICTTLEQVDDNTPVLPDAVLDKELARLVARESKINACQCRILQRLLPFELIKEIVGEAAVAEEKPGAAVSSGGTPLLQESAERRHPRAGSYHDDVAIL